MGWTGWVTSFLVVYFVIGVLFAWFLNQTPYSSNGWLINLLVWPLYALAFIRGRL